MKSTQINFFATEEDYPAFTEFFEAKGAIFIREPLRTESIEFCFEVRKSIAPEWNKSYFTRKGNELDVKLDHIKNQNYYLVNQDISLAVEFSIGEYSAKTKRLERSRFYYIKESWHDGVPIVKDEQFTKWVESLYRSFKKSFLKKGPLDLYYTDRAIKAMEERSGILLGGAFEMQLS